MQIFGIVLKKIDKSKHPYKKAVVLVEDLINPKNTWAIEFRKQLYHAALLLKSGDKIKVETQNDGQIDHKNNFHNNIIATKIERV